MLKKSEELKSEIDSSKNQIDIFDKNISIEERDDVRKKFQKSAAIHIVNFKNLTISYFILCIFINMLISYILSDQSLFLSSIIFLTLTLVNILMLKDFLFSKFYKLTTSFMSFYKENDEQLRRLINKVNQKKTYKSLSYNSDLKGNIPITSRYWKEVEISTIGTQSFKDNIQNVLDEYETLLDIQSLKEKKEMSIEDEAKENVYKENIQILEKERK